jgi:hypothetical protein
VYYANADHIPGYNNNEEMCIMQMQITFQDIIIINIITVTIIITNPTPPITPHVCVHARCTGRRPPPSFPALNVFENLKLYAK